VQAGSLRYETPGPRHKTNRTMPPPFDLQGHRGARGLKPENTLPGFETALDVGVTTVETDVHLTRDGIPILCHDAVVSERLCRRISGHRVPKPASRPAVSALTLAQMHGYRADRKPDRDRFPEQNAGMTPLALWFGQRHGLDPYTPPSLAELFAFAAAYIGEPGQRAGKSARQRDRARQVRFDLELKRVPFRPAVIGDGFDGSTAGLLEQRVVEIVRAAKMVDRTLVRSFDHRSVLAVRRLEPALPASVLVADTAPVSPVPLVRQADAATYCPAFEFLDEAQVRLAHAEGIRVVPWTVNDAHDWERLLDWGVDGITTDFPNRLAVFLRQRGLEF
jgi:glycerophosphoryl diester phosphodiesterase